tara:strand:- start:218 stop:367 length:150 start_codon:yes stop_codon:yes gene_type:complete
MEVCVYCKSSEVYTDQWVNLNDDSVIEGAGELYCSPCSSSTKTMEVNNG